MFFEVQDHEGNNHTINTYSIKMIKQTRGNKCTIYFANDKLDLRTKYTDVYSCMLRNDLIKHV